MARIGNYDVMKQIGEGGFGRVFQAKHIYLGEYACLKQNTRASKQDVELLSYEAKLLWRLDEYHSIPSIKDFFKIDKTSAVITMSYIDGNTLEEIVEKKGPIHPEDCCWITERLLGALYYAHCGGVIHSDVKPQNVFVEPQKHDIKLIDFGISSFKPNGSSIPVGYTPRYAAPELTRGGPPIPESDIYGAGLVMLRALGGDVASKNFRSDTPKEIKSFCEDLLRFDPRERPNWERDNPLEKISEVRYKVFGRRHGSEKVAKVMLKKLKGGGD